MAALSDTVVSGRSYLSRFILVSRPNEGEGYCIMKSARWGGSTDNIVAGGRAAVEPGLIGR
jgi:hypothetical protein